MDTEKGVYLRSISVDVLSIKRYVLGAFKEMPQ